MQRKLLKRIEQARSDIDRGATAFSTGSKLAEIVPEYDKIGGWLELEEAELLFQAASRVKSGCILEIGSYRGRSTVALAAGSSRGVNQPVYAIEPHERAIGMNRAYGPNDRRAFLQALLRTKFFGTVRLVNATSGAVAPGWDKPVELLFIDGDDRYGAVRSYFSDWRPFLTEDASVIFYGATSPGPSQLIQELVREGCLRFSTSIGNLSILKFSAVQIAAEPDRILQVAKTSVYPAMAFDIKDKEPRHRLSKVAHFIYYGGNGSYLYQPIPKCACTSIKTALLELEKLPIDPNEWRRHNKRLNGFPGAGHLSAKEQQELFDGKTNTFKFVIVRDPYSRMASVYTDKFLKGYENKSQYWINLIRAAAAEQGVLLSEKITFEEFVRVASAQTVKQMDAHWRPQYDVGRFGIINWDFVGHLEMLSSDLLYVFEQLKAPKDLMLKVTLPQNVTGASLTMWEGISADTRRTFTRTYGIDFDILRYPVRS